MINDGNGNINGGGIVFFPWFFDRNEDKNQNGKLSHDVYHVYVNGDYVGDRLSLAQGDGGWQAIDDYLKSRGFDNYELIRDGNRIYVEVEDEAQIDSIRNHLKVYTEIR